MIGPHRGRAGRAPSADQPRAPYLAELIGALSLATDLGMGQPVESGLGTCILATRLAQLLGLDRAMQRRVYYLSLLQHVGCTATSHEEAAAFGDELVMRPGLSTLALLEPDATGADVAPGLGRPMAGLPGLSIVETRRRLGTASALFDGWRGAACEVAQMLGDRLGFNAVMLGDLAGVYERWDGNGHPGEHGGDELPITMRVVHVADGARILADAGGIDAVRSILPHRAGGWYDPAIVEALLDDAPDLLDALAVPSRWDAAMGAEPDGPTALSDDRLGRILQAMAEFHDLKSPVLGGHSTGVGRLAEHAGRQAGLGEAEAVSLRHAGWIHDLGRVGISASIWEKPGPLTSSEWEQVRLHAYHTDRVFARIPRSGAADPFAIASLHHERSDGSGYFRGLPAALLPMTGRILAAADAHHAMREARPHRPALDRQAAVAELGREVQAGRIDPTAARAVLQAAGEPRRRRTANVAGLTEREVEVLRLLSQGLSIREIAAALTVSPKTADKHVENIYSKAGVSSRAAATLFAMRHDLLA